MSTNLHDTIVAPATPAGVSAIAVVRVSGPHAIEITDQCFSKELSQAEAYTIHYGQLKDGDQMIDEVLVSIFRAPKSYTGENSVEISCHGSPYIAQRIVQVLCKAGARTAEAGEFTLRAFLNGKLDLAQAEAVADMISSNSEASLQLAVKQMRGGFSGEIAALRQELIDFAGLIELENDFGEEDVEFANRDKLKDLIGVLLQKINALRNSFTAGNVLKSGISTVIAGKPNAGKSTLLNALLKEDRAIVTEIAGTTRDTIEEVFNLNGVQFRLIDTAGIRESEDRIEQMGVGKSKEMMEKADLLIYLFDASESSLNDLEQELTALPVKEHLVLVGNKADRGNVQLEIRNAELKGHEKHVIYISAKEGRIKPLVDKLEEIAANYKSGNETMVNNVRHLEALNKSAESLEKALKGIDTLTSDLVALDIRNALYQLGLITGEVTNDEVLGSIFGRFCIGK